MKKKMRIITIATLLLATLMIAGCKGNSKVENNQGESSLAMEEEETEPVSQTQDNQQSKEIEKSESAIMQIASSMDGKSLILKDILKEKTINTYQVEDNEYVGEYIFTYDAGYAAVTYTEQMQYKKFIRFDQELNVIDEIQLADLISDEILSNSLGMALSSDGSILVIDLVFQLYYYNFNEGTQGYYVEETNDNISFQEIAFVGNDKIAFIGGSDQEQEKDCCVGIYDINKAEIKKCKITNYSAMGLSVKGDVVCVTDTIDPSTSQSSQRVILFDTKEKEAKIKEVTVEGYGSTMACCSEDGKYVYAMSDFSEAEHYYLMKYDVREGKQLNKKEIKFDGEVKIFSIAVSKYGEGIVLTYFNGNSEEGKLILDEES